MTLWKAKFAAGFSAVVLLFLFFQDLPIVWFIVVVAVVNTAVLLAVELAWKHYGDRKADDV